MEKNPGGQKFWQRGGEISWNSILPPPKRHVAPQMPPQIPRPGAATVHISKESDHKIPRAR